ncbi:hypothetical protein [Edaphosphingomonas haloaromaticamans]|uniref:DUF4136 domain-containing protein n=1 Tax=Edaphosphingomonas haloaromaticamans TaxID=653954 RepID=A0A1S1HDC3_9SPHN|nr:hypothetical protein [Sphingomonas haloaromaticamans]OHT19511.1 hypothetical protein BHE75_01497 [Sphingomonas haloaromaticamans]
MTINRHFGALLGLSLLLAGCGGAPRMRIVQTGALPAASGAGFRLDQAGDLGDTVAGCLAGMGFRADDAHPAYLAQVAFSDRSAGTNLFIHEAAAPDAGAEAVNGRWADAPSRDRRHRNATLSFSITDIAAAREIYHVAVIRPHGRKDGGDPRAGMAGALCEAMAGQAAGETAPVTPS